MGVSIQQWEAFLRAAGEGFGPRRMWMRLPMYIFFPIGQCICCAYDASKIKGTMYETVVAAANELSHNVRGLRIETVEAGFGWCCDVSEQWVNVHFISTSRTPPSYEITAHQPSGARNKAASTVSQL